jgi:segregation and condensation protein B
VAYHLKRSYAEVKQAMDDLILEYQLRPEAGIMIRQEKTGYILTTIPELSEVMKLFMDVHEVRLSKAAYETLAVIAINQPVTKAQIEEIRGVDVSGMVSTLRSKQLVRVMGRKNTVGKPRLYGVGMMFFRHFGIRSLKEFKSYARKLKTLGLPPEMVDDTSADELLKQKEIALGNIGIANPEQHVTDEMQLAVEMDEMDSASSKEFLENDLESELDIDIMDEDSFEDEEDEMEMDETS